jgi:hypothetical protein
VYYRELWFMHDPSGSGMKDESLSWAGYTCARSLMKVQYQSYTSESIILYMNSVKYGMERGFLLLHAGFFWLTRSHEPLKVLMLQCLCFLQSGVINSGFPHRSIPVASCLCSFEIQSITGEVDSEIHQENLQKTLITISFLTGFQRWQHLTFLPVNQLL